MRIPKSPLPFSERQVAPDILRGDFETRAPEGAFGGVSNRLAGEEDKTADLAERMQDQSDQFNIQAAKNAFLKQKADFMAKATTSEGINAAQYAPDLEKGPYKTFLGDASKGTLGMAQNARQAKEIRSFLGEQDADMNTVLQKHVATNLFKANLKGAVDGVQDTINQVPTAINDIGVLKDMRGDLDKQVSRVDQLSGSTPEAAKLNLDTQRSNFDQLAVKSMLADQNIQGARGYLQELEKDGQIDTKQLVALKDTVDKTAFHQDAENWYETKGRTMIDSTGNPNLKAIQKSIESMDIPQAQKDIYRKVATTLSGQDIRAQMEAHKSSWENFKNWSAQESKDFSTIISPEKVHAMSLVYGRDENDAHNLEKWYNSQYRREDTLTLNFGSKELQNQHFSDLRQQVALGQIGSLKSLETLQDSLTPKQFTKLKDEWFKTMIGGNDSQKQTVLRRIHQMGVDVYGEDAVGMNNYTNTMLNKYHELGKDGDANTLIKDASEYLKGQNPKTSDIWKGYEAKGYKAGYLQPDQLRSMYTDYGKEVTDALGQTLAKNLGRTPTASEFNSAIDALGGTAGMKRFTPTNNAILSIIRWNAEHPHYKPIDLNQENVQKATEKYHETGGIF